MKRFVIVVGVLCAFIACGANQEVMPEPSPSPEPDPGPEPVEIVVPELVDVPAGSFLMGDSSASGENIDEKPAHSVTFSKGFKMGKYEITNAQYEQYDPAHKRGKETSSRDDEAVVNVSYDDALGYCKWLSEATGRSFRLPTEAEWEYACRAGTTTPYYTGASLPSKFQKNQKTTRNMEEAVIRVGRTDPNSWGLCDMHGNAEEWCMDWYAPYLAQDQTDPAGPSKGQYRVTRGGSHSTPVEYLRSANRMAATPDDFHNQIGFRIVESDVTLNKYESAELIPANMQNVNQTKYWNATTSQGSHEPFWLEPIPFVVPPTDGTLFYSHNHQPAITWCDNGDLLAIWFTTVNENGREMRVVASRLRQGAGEWEPASDFFKVPDRNMTGNSLLRLDDGTLLHMNGVANSGDWKHLSMAQRVSRDNGATWSDPVLVTKGHAPGRQVIAGPIVLKDGSVVQLCDGGAEGYKGSVCYVSRDGKTWETAWDGTAGNEQDSNQKGTVILGIHAGIVQLADGSLMCLGRSNDISGRMPQSVSADGGKTWTYSPSIFDPIGSGQRAVLMRLNEGPIMMATFGANGMQVCVSDDEGKNWSMPKLMTDGKTRILDGGAHTGTFTMDASHAEPKGYFAATQTPDGTIHLISSRIHYRFNLAWIRN